MGDVKTAADGTVADMEAITSAKTIMMVRRAIFYANRARIIVGASDRE